MCEPGIILIFHIEIFHIDNKSIILHQIETNILRGLLHVDLSSPLSFYKNLCDDTRFSRGQKNYTPGQS